MGGGGVVVKTGAKRLKGGEADGGSSWKKGRGTIFVVAGG